MQTLTALKASDFRAWLKKHAKTETQAAVIVHKRHSGIPAPTHKELMFEAICFGWIDTTIKRLDEDRFLRRFAKRSKNSKWSENTLGYAKQLAKAGKMTPQGLHYYQEGLKKPVYGHGIPKNPEMPAELRAGLKKDPVARKNFEGYPPSAKRTLYRWLLGAKREETRKRRVERIVGAAREKKSLF